MVRFGFDLFKFINECLFVMNLRGDDLVLFWISEPITTIVGGPDLYINTGSTLNLTCVVRHSPEPPPHIFWTHDNQVNLLFFILNFD